MSPRTGLGSQVSVLATIFCASIVPVTLNFPLVNDTTVPVVPFLAAAWFSMAAFKKPWGVSQICSCLSSARAASSLDWRNLMLDGQVFFCRPGSIVNGFHIAGDIGFRVGAARRKGLSQLAEMAGARILNRFDVAHRLGGGLQNGFRVLSRCDSPK